MKVKTTTLIALIFCLVCDVFLPLLSLPSSPNAHTALAFKPTPTNKNTNNNTASISKPAVTVNHPPVANAGVNKTVNENTAVTLNGIASDPDLSDKLNYSWRQLAGPSVKLNGSDTTNPSFTTPSNITSDTELKFALTVKDDKGAASNNPATVTITVKHINHPPVANAGTNQTVNPGYVVTLDGSKSRDPDGNITSYSWMQIAGPVVTLNGADTATPSFTAPRLSSYTALKFSLTVKDDRSAISQPAIVAVAMKAAPSSTVQSGNISSSSNPLAKVPIIGKLFGDGNMTATPSIQTNISLANNYQFIRKWGSKGSDIGQFHVIYGIAVDSSGNVYVADSGNDRVKKFDSNGKFITKWGSTSSQQFNPIHLAIDSSGNVYVADYGNSKIQKFDSNGKFITKWGLKAVAMGSLA